MQKQKQMCWNACECVRQSEREIERVKEVLKEIVETAIVYSRKGGSRCLQPN